MARKKASKIGKGKITAKRVNLEKANSQIFIAIAVSSFVIVTSLVFIQIILGEYKFNNRVSQEREAVLDQANRNIASIDELKVSYLALENGSNLITGQGDDSNSTIVLDALPSKYDFPAIASSMDNLAIRNGIFLKTFNGDDLIAEATDSAVTPSPIEIPFSVTVEGTRDALAKFMLSLEQSIRPMKVTNFKISGDDADLEAKIDVITYYQPSVNIDITTKTIDFAGRVNQPAPEVTGGGL